MKKFLLFWIVMLTIQIAFTQENNNFTLTSVNINTSQNNFGKSLYQNEFLIFSSPVEITTTYKMKKKEKKKQLARKDLNFYFGYVDQDGNVLNKQELSKEINSEYDEIDLNFSNDGKTVYFTRNIAPPNKRQHLQLFKADVVTPGYWINIKKLPFNSKQYSVGYSSVDNENKYLYFSSNKNDSFGGFDIYKVKILGNDRYSDPINLGSNINTDGNEITPFMYNKRLYFSSNGRNGYGKLDVYYIDTDKTKQVEHLNSSINTSSDDAGFKIYQNGSSYVSSNNDSDNYNMYFFRSKEEIAKHQIEKQKEEFAINKQGIYLKPNLPNIKLKQKVSANSGSARLAEILKKNSILKSKAEINENVDFSTPKVEESVVYEKPVQKAVVVQKNVSTPKVEESVVYEKPVQKAVVVQKNVSTPKVEESVVYEKPIQKAVVVQKNVSTPKVEESVVYEKPVQKAVVVQKNVSTPKVEESVVYEKPVQKAVVVQKNVSTPKVAYVNNVASNQVNTPVVETTKQVKYKDQPTNNATTNTQNASNNIHKFTSDYERCQFELDNVNNIYFDLNKSYITAYAANELDKVIRIMRKCPNINLIAASYTDSRGSSNYNMQLSQRRAKSTADYIIRNGGFELYRVKGVGYGETRIKNRCVDGVVCSEREHQINRRTQFEISNF